MDVNSLIYLAFIVEENGFQAASRKLNVSKATLSRHITTLEQELGVQLLNRTTRKLSLTEAGVRIFPACQRMAEEYVRIGEISQEAGSVPQGVLRMTAPITAGRIFLSLWLAQFSQRYSKIQLHVDFTDEEINLVEQRYDLALRVGELKSSTMVSRPLAKTSRILCASPSLTNGSNSDVHTIKSVVDLDDFPKIAFKRYHDALYRWRLYENQKSIDLAFHPQAVLNDMTAVLEMAKARAGIVLVPAFVANPYLAEGSLIHILPHLCGEEAHFHLVYLKRENLPRKTRVLIDFLSECAQRDAELFVTFQED
jgi:DNA-binding transcriptional LysR family regulator